MFRHEDTYSAKAGRARGARWSRKARLSGESIIAWRTGGTLWEIISNQHK